jgi:4-hydroxybenzoate polyprenyltransferase
MDFFNSPTDPIFLNGGSMEEAREDNSVIDATVVLNRANAYAELMRFKISKGVRFTNFITLSALWLAAEGVPRLELILIFVFGTECMYRAGCVYNDYLDQDIDARVERTRSRPMPSGKVNSLEALIIAGLLSLVSFLLVLQTNGLTIGLSFVALGFALVYPKMKVWIPFPQLIYGAALAMGAPMAFAAQTGAVPWYVGLLYAAIVCWIIAIDTMYACPDKEDDLKINVKSTAILFGNHGRHAVVGFQLLTLILLIALGIVVKLGAIYYAALVVAVGLTIYQHRVWRELSKDLQFNVHSFSQLNSFVLLLGVIFHYVFQNSMQ